MEVEFTEGSLNQVDDGRGTPGFDNIQDLENGGFPVPEVSVDDTIRNTTEFDRERSAESREKELLNSKTVQIAQLKESKKSNNIALLGVLVTLIFLLYKKG